MATVRYIVDDVDAAITFYCQHLEFREVMHPAPTFAMLARDDLRLALSKPGGGPGGGQTMPDGTVPTPGGWNRSRRQAGPPRRPRRQPGRTVPTTPPGSRRKATIDTAVTMAADGTTDDGR